MKDKNNLSDSELVLDYQSGNKSALSGLVKEWHVQFCKLAYWYVKDADIAKDIAQESWVIIFKKLDTLKNPKQFKSWAISIVNRKAIDFIRAGKRENNKLSTFYNEKDKSINREELEDDKTKLLSILKTEIEGLPTNQKIIIKLFYTEKYSLKQISEVLHISIGTAKSRLFHARERLNKKMKNIGRRI
jgi:RNA polymerase sigma-70 factor (ECF subfamily)